MLERIDSYIGGQYAPPTGGGYADKLDPRTATKIHEVARSQPEDLNRAVVAASGALKSWRDRRPSDRGRILVEIARGLRKRAEALGKIESTETSKPAMRCPHS